MAARTLRERKKQQKVQQSCVFFDGIFYVYTHVDNREGAKVSDGKHRRQMSLEEKHEN